MQVVILTTDTNPLRQVRYLGPYQIAWWLRTNGYSTQVLDFLYFMTSEQRIALFKKYITTETKIVGFSPFVMLESPQIITKGEGPIFDILNEIKDNFPWVKIVIGGQFVRGFLWYGHKRLAFKVDAVFKDESENSFLEYCNHVFKNEAPPIAHLGPGNNKIYKPSSTSFDIQSCSMKFAENDFILPGESLPLELSRGCIFKCKFCQYPNIGKDKDDFNKSMNCIRESLISNYNLFGTTRYHITDDTLNSHRERTQKFYQMTKELPFKIEYIGYARLDLINIWPEQFESLPDSGLVSCHFGIESFDPISCNMIGKGWGAKNYKPALTQIGELWGDDVIVRCSMIAGLGHETEKDWDDATEWYFQSRVHDFHYNKLFLSPSLAMSEFERDPEKHGYRFVEGKWETDYMTEARAAAWCSKFKERTEQHRVPSVWNLSAIRNFGFSYNDVLNTTYYKMNKRITDENLNEKLVAAYLDKSMNY